MTDRFPGRGIEDEAAVSEAVTRRSPDTAFGLLADNTRIAILQALGKTPQTPVAFSQLRDRVGLRDSGHFNYHLGKLVGSFVRKTHDGYELTHTGRQIVGKLYAGSYTTDATVEPIPIEEDCPLCDGQLIAEYADEMAITRCTECAEWLNEFSFPPGSLEGFERGELPAAFDRWMQYVCRGTIAGFCDTCDGRIEGQLLLDPEGVGAGVSPAAVSFECRRCGSTARLSAALPVMLHPCTEGFLFDNGLDVTTAPTWRITGDVDRHEVTVLGNEPPRAQVQFEIDGDAVTGIITEDATISEIKRHSVSGD